MSETQSLGAKAATTSRPAPEPAYTFSGLRALAWHGSVLLASQAYTVLSASLSDSPPRWRMVAQYRPAWWRTVTASAPLTSRFFDDGFGSLAPLPSGHIVASVPEGIVSLAPGDMEFHITHQLHGARNARIVACGRSIFWSGLTETRGGNCCIYASADHGLTWEVAHVFDNAITAIRGLVHDEWENCLWILVGGEKEVGQVYRASLDFRMVEVAISGNGVRVGTCVPVRDAVYFGSYDLRGPNHIFRLRRNGSVVKVASIHGPAVSSCRVGHSVFISTMANWISGHVVRVYSSADGDIWEEFLAWKKDYWPDVLGKGCASLAGGNNGTGLLAVSTVAVSGPDLAATLWRT